VKRPYPEGVLRRLPKALIISGAVLMVIGVLATITMLIAQNRCQHDQIGMADDPTVIAACASYQTGADWAYGVIVAGAVVIVGGAVTGSPVIQRRRSQ
jgi:hypothetical protein